MYYKRRHVIAGAIILFLLIFVVRLFYLQILSDDYKKWADSNAFQKRTLIPSRGVIYDRNGKLLVFNQPSYEVMVIMREARSIDTLDFCRTVGITKESFDSRMANIKNTEINPGYSPHIEQVFLTQLSVIEYGVLQEKLYKFPGFYTRNRALREYGTTNAANILGYIGEVSKEDIGKDDYYVPRDYIGQAGVESSYETILRGEKGAAILLRDAVGRIKGKFEDGKNDVTPVSGKNITLTIDIDLQAYGEKLLKNKRGAIVMIEPETGEILCLVTSPSYDPNLLNGRQRNTNYPILLRDPDRPFYDRALQGYYPPGSTFKPSQALIYLQEGVITKEKTYTCESGYTYAGGRPYCHAHPSPTSVVPALSTSCNSFFCWGLHDLLDSRSRYKSIQEAFEVWKNYMVKMGYGYPIGVDLPSEARGFIPNSNVYDKWYNERWSSGSIISNAIGQGEIVATPLQICNLAATIANRGYYIVPHIVREIQDMPLDEKYRNKKYTGIDRAYYEIVVEGMRSAVTGGTCRDLILPYPTDACGKTGTAQNPHGRDNSACIAFAPRNNPRIAISVYVEQGGLGRQVAVPIARLMLEKYLYGDLLDYDRWIETRMLNWSTLPGSPDYIKKITVEDEEHDD